MSQERTEFYANTVGIVMNVYDVTLQFSTQSAVAVEKGKPPITEVAGVCNVRMSPQHAKSLVALLARHIVEYERTHGITLPIPGNLKGLWDTYIRQGQAPDVTT